MGTGGVDEFTDANKFLVIGALEDSSTSLMGVMNPSVAGVNAINNVNYGCVAVYDTQGILLGNDDNTSNVTMTAVAGTTLNVSGSANVTGSVTATFSNRQAAADTIGNATTSKTITMPETQPDATYHVSLTSIDANVGLPVDIRVTSRTTTQFTLTYTITTEDTDITYEVIDIP